ncbi:MAG: NAD-dependent malic enzyme [Micrococcales bacterium]|nr:NAD-dependent malic enzyme [Micrococcales bacterium]
MGAVTESIQRARATTASYSITMRIYAGTDPRVIGALAVKVADSGGITTALDIVDSQAHSLVIDLTCSASDAGHAQELRDAVETLEGVRVHKVSDRVFLLHLGGKIAVQSKVNLRNRQDLAMAYTPGVGRVSQALFEHPEDVSRLTIKGNTVAVVTDGTAVLGLGNLGPGAALPVMEGKAALFKRFADIDAWPICLDTTDVDEIVRTVELIAPGFGGINLEDISAPRCFEVEAKLRDRLDIPVFHDDQHGTAIVVLAALKNALRCVDKTLPEARIIVSGGGAAGSAIVHLLLAAGAVDVTVSDRPGLLRRGDESLSPQWRGLAARTNPRGLSGTLRDGLQGADVFIGVSAPNLLAPEWIDEMAEEQIVFALANPNPEVDIYEATQRAAVVASGRSDYPNQINNVLAFPGVFRGLLDARSSDVTTEMLISAADAIASVVGDEQLNPSYIIPSVFHPEMSETVAKAIVSSVPKLAPSTVPPSAGPWPGVDS